MDAFFSQIENEVKQYELRLVQARTRYTQAIAYQQKIEPTFGLDTLNYDSLNNLRLKRLHDDLITIISAHGEALYHLEYAVSEAQKMTVPRKLNMYQMKSFKADWLAHKAVIASCLEQEESAYQAQQRWRKRLYIYYHPETEYLTDSSRTQPAKSVQQVKPNLPTTAKP
jgi:hypothetical protein